MAAISFGGPRASWLDLGATGASISCVNHDGTVAAGYSGEVALWFARRGFVDLKQYLLGQGLKVAADWRFSAVTGMSSSRNALIGNGIDPLGRPRGFLVTGLDLTACYPDCDLNGTLTFFDFLCFQNSFAAGDAYADCDSSGAIDFLDFLCFQNEFAAGCP